MDIAYSQIHCWNMLLDFVIRHTNNRYLMAYNEMRMIFYFIQYNFYLTLKMIFH